MAPRKTPDSSSLTTCNPSIDPARLEQTVKWLLTGARILLLHCYPYHREAGYLAHVFPHAYLDVGLAVNYTGARAHRVIAESLELAPFDRVLFSSDAYGLAELFHLGATLFTRGLLRTVNEWIVDGEWDAAEAERVIRMICGENARRVYRLGARDEAGR